MQVWCNKGMIPMAVWQRMIPMQMWQRMPMQVWRDADASPWVLNINYEQCKSWVFFILLELSSPSHKPHLMACDGLEVGSLHLQRR